MFKKITKKDKRTNLEKEIDSVLYVMHTCYPDSDEYTTMSENLERLYKAKANEKDRHVSPDTKLIVAGNLLGIALILWHEKADIITSKALGFVLKGRV
jgi:hypothetical protein